ncbi:hypothetical protein ACS0TY_033303 [Phlomoides rotata]
MKLWNITVFGSLEENIEKKRSVIQMLDLIDDVFGLEEMEIIRAAVLFRDLKWKDNLLAQKSRCRWLKEGDSNSRFFHNFISNRRKWNEFVGINIDGVWHEEVEEVKGCIFKHFRKYFKKDDFVRLSFAADFTKKKII